MNYIQPADVDSPKKRWRLDKVLFDSGKGEWSIAEGQWDHNGRWKDVLAIRWNGSDELPKGHPQSRGLATWFIVPNKLEDAIRSVINGLTQ